MSIEVNTHHENLFFATTTIATKSIELIANNEKYTLITNTSAYLAIPEIDYN